jgi:pyridoxamine 5'-phosphate oxidase
MIHGPDPIERFRATFDRARRSEPHDATGVALATADRSAAPSLRMVLLKEVDARGFVFFTNYGSRKAEELEENPRSALCFYWPSLGEQVRVEGTVRRIGEAESDAYFATRQRGSQLGAWASRQSEPLESRRSLISRYLRLKARFLGRPVPRPEFWGGYRLVPDRIEFWNHRRFRLHDRRLYTRENGEWRMERLNP